jgi:uncharacterized protein YjiS (DUF1127 family)
LEVEIEDGIRYFMGGRKEEMTANGGREMFKWLRRRRKRCGLGKMKR